MDPGCWDRSSNSMAWIVMNQGRGLFRENSSGISEVRQTPFKPWHLPHVETTSPPWGSLTYGGWRVEAIPIHIWRERSRFGTYLRLLNLWKAMFEEAGLQKASEPLSGSMPRDWTIIEVRVQQIAARKMQAQHPATAVVVS